MTSHKFRIFQSLFLLYHAPMPLNYFIQVLHNNNPLHPIYVTSFMNPLYLMYNTVELARSVEHEISSTLYQPKYCNWEYFYLHTVGI